VSAHRVARPTASCDARAPSQRVASGQHVASTPWLRRRRRARRWEDRPQVDREARLARPALRCGCAVCAAAGRACKIDRLTLRVGVSHAILSYGAALPSASARGSIVANEHHGTLAQTAGRRLAAGNGRGGLAAASPGRTAQHRARLAQVTDGLFALLRFGMVLGLVRNSSQLRFCALGWLLV
jgi:hypothetical protein